MQWAGFVCSVVGLVVQDCLCLQDDDVAVVVREFCDQRQYSEEVYEALTNQLILRSQSLF